MPPKLPPPTNRPGSGGSGLVKSSSTPSVSATTSSTTAGNVTGAVAGGSNNGAGGGSSVVGPTISSTGAYNIFLSSCTRVSNRRDSAPAGVVQLDMDDDDDVTPLPKLRTLRSASPAPPLSSNLHPRSVSAAPTFLTSTSATPSSKTSNTMHDNPINGLLKNRRGGGGARAVLSMSSTPQQFNGNRSVSQVSSNAGGGRTHLLPPVSRKGGSSTPSGGGFASSAVDRRNEEDSAILESIFSANSGDDQDATNLLKKAMQGRQQRGGAPQSPFKKVYQQQLTFGGGEGRAVKFVEDSFHGMHAEEGDDLSSFLDRLAREVERFEAASQERRNKLMGGDQVVTVEVDDTVDSDKNGGSGRGLFGNGQRSSAASSTYRLRSAAVSFAPSEDVERQLEAVLAAEGLELDVDDYDEELVGWSEETLLHQQHRNHTPSVRPLKTNKMGEENRLVSAAQALDLLSLRAVQATTMHVAPSDRVAAAEKLKAKISKVQTRLSLQDSTSKPTSYTSLFDGTLGSSSLNNGSTSGGNKYLLLNKATRDEFDIGSDGAPRKRGPTLIERSMMASSSAQRAKLLEAVNKSGLIDTGTCGGKKKKRANHNGGEDEDDNNVDDPNEEHHHVSNGGRLVYHNAHVSHDGITERSLLLKKIEILRLHRPLRLQFLKHISQVKEAKKRLGGAGGMGSFFIDDSGMTVNASVQLRNISAIHTHKPEGAEESRKAFFKKRWDMVCEARERRNDLNAKKHKRYIELVERARVRGLDYDTGIEVPDDLKYTHGSLVNDQAATWFLFVCLSASQRILTARARKIMIERREREGIACWQRTIDTNATKVQMWWRRAYHKRRGQRSRDAASMIVDYLRRLPKIQVRFRLAMRDLIFRVAKLQMYFRSMFAYRRRRHESNLQQLDRVINEECDRLRAQTQSHLKERKKSETQLSIAPKARKPVFHNQIKSVNQTIGELRRRIEFLLALSDSSKQSMISTLSKPKERMYTMAAKEYGARLGEKYLAIRNPHVLVEMKTGQRTMGGLMTTKEQRLVERVLHTPIVRPFISLRITDDEFVGQLEEQGVRLGEIDFLEATLKNSVRNGSHDESVASMSASAVMNSSL